MPKHEKLALFDLDGTLVDDTYALTDVDINGEIEAAQGRGWHVGLSSDTPYEVLVSWRQQLGMNGPIIAEKGAVVELGEKLSFDKKTAINVAAARVAIAKYLENSSHTTVWIGNSTEAVRQKRVIGDPGYRSILINNLSRCSLRFYVRQVTADGDMAINNTVTQETVDELSKFYPSFDYPSIDNNPNFGLMIIADGLVDKRTGLMTLLKAHPYQRRIMVGNSMGDYIGEDLVEQLAVANSESDYRQVATTMKRPLTSGCIDALNCLT